MSSKTKKKTEVASSQTIGDVAAQAKPAVGEPTDILPTTPSKPRARKKESDSTKRETPKTSSKTSDIRQASQRRQKTESTAALISEDIKLPNVPLLKTPAAKKVRVRKPTPKKPSNSCDRHGTLQESPGFLPPGHVLCEKCAYGMFSYLSVVRNLVDGMMIEIVDKFLAKPSQCSRCLKEELAKSALESQRLEGFPQQAERDDPPTTSHGSRGDLNRQRDESKQKEKARHDHSNVLLKGPTNETNVNTQILPANSNVEHAISREKEVKPLDQIQHHEDPGIVDPMSEVHSTPHAEDGFPSHVRDQIIESNEITSTCQVRDQIIDSNEITSACQVRDQIIDSNDITSAEAVGDRKELEHSQSAEHVQDWHAHVQDWHAHDQNVASVGAHQDSSFSNQDLQGNQTTEQAASPPGPTQASQILENDRPEAFVTVVTNNAQALGAVVLGHSLCLVEASRQLVAVVFGAAVSPMLSYQLSQVYSEVVRVPPSAEKAIGLLRDPELGVSFEKLLVWSLEQFSKCVYLDPDTLVIQNCDELFEREELSAVPDNGWPDCFNPGMFVFRPSSANFDGLVALAQAQGPFDGGDQHVLNMYFDNWKSDLSKKLPFLYNLMASVCYSYTPAFKKFGRDVKIVNFSGSSKPWELQVHPATGQLGPKANVHPSYVVFVRYWLQIFLRRVAPLTPEGCQELLKTREIISPKEVLADAGLFLAGDAQSMPMRLSIRLRSPRVWPSSTQMDLAPAENQQEEERNEESLEPDNVSEEEEDIDTEEESVDVGNQGGEKEEAASVETDQEKPVDPYRSMQAWEQGRMDYLGHDRSDNVLKRLDLLIRERQAK